MRNQREFGSPAPVWARKPRRSRNVVVALRATVALLALFVFLTDFVTPTTPTPIAVGVSQHVTRPSLAIINWEIVATADLVLLIYFVSLVCEIASSDSQLLDRTCIRRC